MSKAERAELENLRGELQRLEGIVSQLEGDYSDEDSYDEYDDEDSQVEDVISLDERASQSAPEEEEEEFFEGDDDPSKKLADKAKELANKTLLQGATGLEPIKKVGEYEEKVDKLKEEMQKDAEEAKKTANRKNTDDLITKNKELEQEDKKKLLDVADKKSIPSTTDVNCAETTNSMAMTMNTFNNGPSRACQLKKQETTIKSKRRGLSRMSSKMSISTRRRGTRFRGADHKVINELKLNMNKALEDIRKLKSFEHDSELTFRRFENTLVDLKKKNDMFMGQHNVIIKKQEEIEKQNEESVQISSEHTKKVVQIYKEIQKMINTFKSEYTYGFKKIIKAEVDINFLNQQLKFIKTKIKPKEEKINKHELLKQIDNKFELLYQQVSEMAEDQAKFNSKIQREQENLKEPLEVEISKIREESNIMLRELERTQQNNREMLVNRLNKSAYTEATPQKMNAWLNQSTGFHTKRKDRTLNNLSIEHKPATRARYSTPSHSGKEMTRLKRFNFDKKPVEIPNFTNLLKGRGKL